jgi:hypothetical protein
MQLLAHTKVACPRARVGIALVCVLFANPASNVRASGSDRQTSKARLGLARVTPRGWFSMLVPATSKPIQSHADIDGGFFEGTPIWISFSYYAYINTPNFLIDNATGHPRLHRGPEQGAHKTRINGRTAWMKFVRNDVGQYPYRFGYRVEYFGLLVPLGDGQMLPGTISFDIATNESRYLKTVRRIVRSISFAHRAQPN